MRQFARAEMWLSERRRSAASLIVAALTAVLLSVVVPDSAPVSVVDLVVLALLAYLLAYLGVTTTAFGSAPHSRIVSWAERESRGTILQRYVFGTAPGPGASTAFAVAALAVAVLWLPGHGTSLPAGPRTVVAISLVVTGWLCVVVSFAVTFHADNLVESEGALEFPGDQPARWADYVYFAVSVMTTFGTTDVAVVSREMRRTVTANSIIAFVFNAVTIAASVSVVSGL